MNYPTSKYFLTLARDEFLANPLPAPGGYLVEQDGTTHCLLKPFTHGITMALLNPHDAELAGYHIPTDGSPMIPGFFQAFELENCRCYDYMRVCTTRFLGGATVDLGASSATHAQLEVLTAIGKCAYIDANTEVCIEGLDMPWFRRMQQLTSENKPGGFARERQTRLKAHDGGLISRKDNADV